MAGLFCSPLEGHRTTDTELASKPHLYPPPTFRPFHSSSLSTMASQGLSRKRPAVETSPNTYQNSYSPPSGLGNYGGLDPQVSNDQFLQFGYQPQIENSHISYHGNPVSQQANHSSEIGSASNQLARRPASQVVSRGRGGGDSSDPQWTEQGNAQRVDSAWADDLDDLRKRAQIAKREAQSKRKQIPPFVQKLAR